MIPKTKIDAENQLFYVYNTASQNAVNKILEIRSASNSETFDGTDEQITSILTTEYGNSEAGKVAISELQVLINSVVEAGNKIRITTFKQELPDLVSRAIKQKEMKDASSKETK